MEKVHDLQVMCSADEIFNSPIVLYGASGGGKKMLELLAMAIKSSPTILGFADSNLNKTGEEFCGYTILNPLQLKELSQSQEIIIIIASEYIDSILDVINRFEIRAKCIFTSYAVEKSLYYNYLDPRFSDTLREKVEYFDLCQRITSGQVEELIDGLKPWNIRYTVPDETVWIFTTNKVGSLSIWQELTDKGIRCNHIHDFFNYFRHNRVSEEIRQRWFDYLKKSKLKLIAGVREPIARDFSKFFQLTQVLLMNENCHKKNMKECCLDFFRSQTKTGPKFFQDHFYTYNNYWEDNLQYGAEFDFFDLEIKKVFGIDIYKEPFDKEQGYKIYKKDNLELLVYRLEDFSKLQTVFADYVDCPDFQVQHCNEGKGKLYRYAYEAMKREVPLEQGYIDFYYKENPRMNYFYTEEEKEVFLEQWKQRGNIIETI